MIRIAVCDDEEKSAHHNEKAAKSILERAHIHAKIAVYLNSEYLLGEIEDGVYFDLVLLDIEMPNQNGMVLAKKIKQLCPNVIIIFVTSHEEFAIASYELDIFRYIPKTSLDIKLSNAIEDAVKLIKIQETKSYIISSANRYEKLPYRDILYIKRAGNNSVFVKQTGETAVRKALSKVFEEIDQNDFVIIDKGCIVNLVHLQRIKDNNAILTNNESLPISRNRLKEVKLMLNKFWGCRI